MSNANIWCRNVILATTQNARKTRLYLREGNHLQDFAACAKRNDVLAMLNLNFVAPSRGGRLRTQVLHHVPARRLPPHRPPQNATTYVQPESSEQVGAAGGSGGEASRPWRGVLARGRSRYTRVLCSSFEQRADRSEQRKCPRGVPLEEGPPSF
jgi:hypothetical protein